MEPLGVYVHYPFCRSRCSYCDFPIAVVPEPDIPHDEYRGAVVAELHARAPALAGRELVSIYIGGGTPSLARPSDVEAVVAAVRAAFSAQRSKLEITLEANPVDCTPDRLEAWRRAGITRLSIGAQSADPEELVTLGRDHRMGEGREALARAAGAGFESVSADLILGVPGPGNAGKRALRSLDALAGSGPDHLSVYELTFEPSTPLDARRRRGEIAALGEDELEEIYRLCHSELGSRGYEHYEISSFARPGHRAVHNSLYWRAAEYLGLGSGASSFVRHPGGSGERWRNHRSVHRYLAAAPDERIAERDSLSPADLRADRLWLGLRTAEGVDERAFEGRSKLLAYLLDTGLARRHENYIRPTLRGFLCADYVAQRVIDDRW